MLYKLICINKYGGHSRRMADPDIIRPNQFPIETESLSTNVYAIARNSIATTLSFSMSKIAYKTADLSRTSSILEMRTENIEFIYYLYNNLLKAQ